MLLALLRRTFLFAALVFLVGFALIALHALLKDGAIPWTAGLGAAAAAAVFVLSWTGMIRSDDYLTPRHTRIFFAAAAIIAGFLGFGLLAYFGLTGPHPSSHLLFFGLAPAGVAVLFVIIAIIRMKEAYVLPATYRPETKGIVKSLIPVGVSVLALITSAGSLSLTVQSLRSQLEIVASISDQPKPVKIEDDPSRQARADEIFQRAMEQKKLERYRRAHELFQEAADYGHAEADYELALIYSGDGFLRNLEQAREQFEIAKASDHLEATFRLGKAYRHGELGLEPDFIKARENLEIAAAAGHVQAQLQLGHLYNRGDGVEVNHEKAFSWFLRAAEQGDATAQNDVGIFYLNGTGVEADAEKGVYWLTVAAEQGASVAEYNLGRAFYTGEVVEQDYTRAHTYFERLAEKNIPYGFQMLGLQYLHGHGTDKDETAAFEAFAKGAARGDAVSEYYLGYCYLNGLGTEKNASAGLTYVSAAAEKGDAAAQLLQGRIYLAGEIILQDKAEAAKWLRLAAANGSEEAVAEINALEPKLSEEERAEVAESLAPFQHQIQE